MTSKIDDRIGIKDVTCRSCSKEKLVEFINFGPQPNGNQLLNFEDLSLGKSDRDLRIGFCPNCASVQNISPLTPIEMFGDHPYLTASSKPYLNELKDFASKAVTYCNAIAGDLVVDIGANDGSLLKYFKEFGLEVLGVDPSETAFKYSSESGIEVIQDFWDENLAQMMIGEYAKPKIITSTASFYHMGDIRGWVSGVDDFLAPDGILAVEFVYLLDILENISVDQFYHEHTYIHSITSIDSMLTDFNLEIKHVERVATQGGSVIAFIARKDSNYLREREVDDLILEEISKYRIKNQETYQAFVKNFYKNQRLLVSTLEEIKRTGGKIGGIGASLRGISLLNFYGIESNMVDFLLEVNPEKIGKYAPKSLIPIIDEDEIDELPSHLLVLAWTFEEFLIKKFSKYISLGGNLIFPQPSLHIVNSNSLAFNK